MTMQHAAQVPTPELDKQSEILHSGRPEAVQEFYDWLKQRGYRICSVESTDRFTLLDEDSTQEWMPIRQGPMELFAEFFGVDLGKVEAERRALLEAIRQPEETVDA